jgi:hypothetical protein
MRFCCQNIFILRVMGILIGGSNGVHGGPYERIINYVPNLFPEHIHIQIQSPEALLVLFSIHYSRHQFHRFPIGSKVLDMKASGDGIKSTLVPSCRT